MSTQGSSQACNPGLEVAIPLGLTEKLTNLGVMISRWGEGRGEEELQWFPPTLLGKWYQKRMCKPRMDRDKHGFCIIKTFTMPV